MSWAALAGWDTCQLMSSYLEPKPGLGKTQVPLSPIRLGFLFYKG